MGCCIHRENVFTPGVGVNLFSVYIIRASLLQNFLFQDLDAMRCVHYHSIQLGDIHKLSVPENSVRQRDWRIPRYRQCTQLFSLYFRLYEGSTHMSLPFVRYCSWRKWLPILRKCIKFGHTDAKLIATVLTEIKQTRRMCWACKIKMKWSYTKGILGWPYFAYMLEVPKLSNINWLFSFVWMTMSKCPSYRMPFLKISICPYLNSPF